PDRQQRHADATTDVGNRRVAGDLLRHIAEQSSRSAVDNEVLPEGTNPAAEWRFRLVQRARIHERRLH
ncbi:MAG: hypothetical protein OXH43_09745, partial [Acidimicrobiaceae bacterium]|nr:hypothetical protein [Acidimicrobiaceae bacterium]